MFPQLNIFGNSLYFSNNFAKLEILTGLSKSAHLKLKSLAVFSLDSLQISFPRAFILT